MHGITAVAREAAEIVHGGSIWSGAASYLVGRVHPGRRIELVAKRFRPQGFDASRLLWQTSMHRPPGRVGFAPHPAIVARMALDGSGRVLRSMGSLAPWRQAAPSGVAR
jgi:hypothetical protein